MSLLHRGLLEMVDFERRVIPTFGITDVVLDTPTEEQVDLILNSGKKQKFISAQWGFGSGDENVALPSAIICLVCGEPGTGKTAIAHALAYELGQPIKVSLCVRERNQLLSSVLILTLVSYTHTH